MSRLWPETIKIALHADHCAVRRGKLVRRHEFALGSSMPEVLGILDGLLAEGKPFGRFAQAEVFVSDAFGWVALMPWQSRLDSEAQIQTYGRACLETLGSQLGDDWVVHAGFRRHAAAGLAAALPASLIGQLRDLLAQRRIGLRSVLPITAAAYWFHRSDRKQGASLLWLEEQGRLTALAYRFGELHAIDVEPVLKAAGAERRLVSRLVLGQGKIARAEFWAASGHIRASELGSMLNGAAVAPVKYARWSVA